MATQNQTTNLNVTSNADLKGIKATETELRNYGDELRRIKKEMEDLGSPELTNRAASQFLSRMKVETRKAQQEQINEVIGGPGKSMQEQIKGTMDLLRGGGALVAFSMIGQSLAGASQKMKELRNDWHELGQSDRVVRIMESLPMGIGAFATTGRNIRELFTQEETQMNAILNTARLQDQTTQLRAQHIREQTKALDDQAVILRKIANDTAMAGLGGAAAGFTGRKQAMDEETKAAELKTKQAKDALAGYVAMSSAEQSRVEDLRRKASSQGGQLSKPEYEELKAGEKLMKEKLKERELLAQAAVNAEDAQTALEAKTAATKVTMQRDYQNTMTELTAQGNADRYAAMQRGAESQQVMLKEQLRRQKEQYEHDQKAGADPRGLNVQQREIENTEKKLKESQAAIERERTQFAVDQGKRLGDIKAALQADDLRKQGQFAAATIEQLRQEHAAKLEQMKRDEAEEIRQNPEYADAIRKKFAGQRDYDQRKLENDSRMAQLDETRTRQRYTDMTFDFGQRMQQRGKPTYTFDAQGVDAGETGVGDTFKQRQAQDRQKLDAQREAIGFIRQMRDFMQGIAAKMNAINIGAQ